ncbi:hypothetical protein R6Q59_028666 [Mikania micrantha]
MMKTLSIGSELPSTRIKTNQDRGFCVSSRPLSSDQMSKHNSCIEVYYGEAQVAVPFKWESQPGTPRVRFHETPLPPLTPPPSFLFNSPKTPNRNISKPKGGILQGVLPMLTSTRRSHNSLVSQGAYESSSLFSSSSYLDSPSPLYTSNNDTKNRRKSFEDQDGYASLVSTLCFYIRWPHPHGCK